MILMRQNVSSDATQQQEIQMPTLLRLNKNLRRVNQLHQNREAKDLIQSLMWLYPNRRKRKNLTIEVNLQTKPKLKNTQNSLVKLMHITSLIMLKVVSLFVRILLLHNNLKHLPMLRLQQRMNKLIYIALLFLLHRYLNKQLKLLKLNQLKLSQLLRMRKTQSKPLLQTSHLMAVLVLWILAKALIQKLLLKKRLSLIVYRTYFVLVLSNVLKMALIVLQ